MEFKKYNSFLHGGDYNVEQWLDRPDVLSEDIRLMKLANVNVVTLGVFSWACLEPKEGIYTFEWLDQIMDAMHKNDIYVILATPSGGKPPWMVKKYPDIMRTGANRVRLLYGDRENQCNSNKVFRSKVKEIDELLAKRYGKHPALLMWHISNEMYGVCHCDDCQANFRDWLKDKYKTIENLNKQYNSIFWSHKYSDWEELESPAPHGEASMHGLSLDYKRFYSDLSIDFLKMEIEAVRKYSTKIPVTTNMFHLDCGIDYRSLAKIVDLISWDSYPRWHCGSDKSSEYKTGIKAQFTYDYARTLKDKSFLLMESTPSTANGFEVCKLKRPKMHMLSSIQAIASGSDSVQYFQWRKSLGGYEKFHGAVIGHDGSEHTRVFRDVMEVGENLKKISYLKDTYIKSEVALLYDWDNLRALYEQKNLKRNKKNYDVIVEEHYEALLQNYVSVDIIDRNADFSRYKMIVAPLCYMFSSDTPKKNESYIANGGHFVLGYYSGIVNENDLVYEGFSPHGLNHVFDVKVEEIDSICDDEWNEIIYKDKSYKVLDYCELIHTTESITLSRYQKDFYEGYSAIVKNAYEKGRAYYIACRTEVDFLYEFYKDILEEAKVEKLVSMDYVQDVLIQKRQNESDSYVIFMNFSSDKREIAFNKEVFYLDGYEYKIVTM